MVIVLTEGLDAEEAVELAGFLLAVDHIQLVVADGQFLVGMDGPLVGVHGVGAVHGLCGHDVLGVGIAGRAGNDEHVVLIVGPVAGDQPELAVVDDRGGDLLIAVSVVDVAPEADQSPVELPSSGQPVGHAGSCLVEHEQIQFGTQLLVVSFHGFADHVQMSLELVLVREYIDIDPLQRVSVLVASPVCAGVGLDLKGGLEQVFGIVHVRASAQVHEVFACIVNGDQLVVWQIVDQLCLEFLVSEHFQGLGSGDFFPCPVFLSLQDLPHLVLDGRVVLLGDGPGKHKIIIHAVCDLGTDGILDISLAEDLDDGLGQDMGHGMPVDL